MIKTVVFRVIRWRLKSFLLPKLKFNVYKKIFSYSYKFFTLLKPSQIWIIILALLNKTELKKLISIPSVFVLFSSILSDSSEPQLNSGTLYARMESNNLFEVENKWENFFFLVIILAIIKRFTICLFKFLWIPFKIAFIFYILKQFGYDFSYIFNVLNNISLGIIDWFYLKITNFF